jgi:hypothetical protein
VVGVVSLIGNVDSNGGIGIAAEKTLNFTKIFLVK